MPHPIPYQGSKRNIASKILRYFPADIETLIEPFAGSAAITLAAASNNICKKYWLNDLNKPLMDLWKIIINQPEIIGKQYEDVWSNQFDEYPKQYYNRIRDEFNTSGRPDFFLFLLVRCVKASVRYNANGEFNQSPDNRRRGTKPKTMKEMIFGASHLLRDKTTTTSKNYRDILEKVQADDLVYMDPPYQGVCRNRDTRYITGVQYCEFIEVLKKLNHRKIRYIVSYDGRVGNKIYGKTLPDELHLTHIEINAGRSTQATLLGRQDSTIESLYLSPTLKNELTKAPCLRRYTPKEQMDLLEMVL